MTIDFSPDRWAKVKATYAKWWAGELDRPIVPISLAKRDPGREEPRAPYLSMETCHDLSIPAEDIIDRIDYELSKNVYLGDSFPFFGMQCFGAGIVAAFLGAKLDNSSGIVWFFPPEELPIEEIHFEYDPDNVWFRRIKDICAAGMQRWQGQVLMSMTDLGGTLDILSAFRSAEGLLLDLYDKPDEVKRLTWEAHEAWRRYFNELDNILQPINPGYTHWAAIYSDRPTYMLQCDFCYMIGSEMFDEFVKPELEASCAEIPRAFYHMDGKGQIPHLDSLLTIDELDGIQWIPGDGQPSSAHYPDLFRKIRDAGKLIQVLGSFDTLDAVIEQTGTPGRIHCMWEGSDIAENEAQNWLAKFGVE